MNDHSSTPEIVIRGVTKTFDAKDLGTVVALDGIDLDVAKGEFVCLLGPSGCGKSTLLNAVAGFSLPTSGSVKTDGVEVTAPGPDRAMVFQEYALFPWRTVLKNVSFGLDIEGMPGGEARRQAGSYLETVGLTGWETHSPGELSGGQQQRVAIARAIVTNPAVLLADEPTGNLDTARSKEIMELLTQLNRERGITVIMVTHESDMAAYATRIIRFMDGLVASDSPNGGKSS